MRKWMLVMVTLMLTLPLAGCWDRKEINELALVMAKGIDLTDDNQIRVSVQVAIPSKVGGAQTGSGKGEGGKSFYVVSGTGRTVSEADQRIQEKLPRQLYLPHLRIILIGDRLARSGMDKILDHFGRNPPSRLRTALLVAKDKDALSIMQTPYPLESISGEAVRKLERQLIGTNTTLLDYMIQAASEGTDQYATSISLMSDKSANQGGAGQQNTDQVFAMHNQAVFRDLKLVGYLDRPESILLLWLEERLRYSTITVKVPNTKGTISVQLTHARRRAQTYVNGNRVTVRYQLSGTGMLTENGTGLDADEPEVMYRFQRAVNQYVEQAANQCLTDLFKKMNADPTGVGQMVYRQHPWDWERIKAHWRDDLPNVQYSVSARLRIVEGGKSGPPLFGKPQRGIRQQGATSKVGEGEQ